MSENKFHPFSSGSQAGDWEIRNCMKCRKYYEGGEPITCEILAVISEAYITDGALPMEFKARMGYTEENKGKYTWDCPEKEAK